MKIKLFSFALCAVFAAGFAMAQDEGQMENAVYIRFKASSSPKTANGSRMATVAKETSLQPLQKEFGLHETMFCMRTLGSPVLERTFLLSFDSTAKADELIRRLQEDKRIELVEKVSQTYVFGSPQAAPKAEEGNEGDPLYESSIGSWHYDLIHAEEAWAEHTATPNVKVAIVDNATWGDHPDLGIAPENQHNIVSGQSGSSAPPSEVPQDPNCSNVNNCPSYNWSHGTHTAGLVGAIRNNGIGIASLGSGATLISVSCPGTDPSGLAMTNSYGGVSWAVEHGAKILNLSWGRSGISETERAVIQACVDKGVIIVAAAGNNGYKDFPMYPAYLPGVISVASVNSNRQVSSFSNYGEWVTVASPGGFLINSSGNEATTCVLSTTYCTAQKYSSGGYGLTGQYYDGMYGTSMATPVTTGLCALLLSVDSTLDPYTMRDVLMSSAQAVDPGPGEGRKICSTSGVIDAAAAVRLVEKKRSVAMPSSLQSKQQNYQIAVSWQKPQSENEVDSYEVFVDNKLVSQTEETEFMYDLPATNRTFRIGVRALYKNGDTSLRAGADLYVPALVEMKVSVRPVGCGTIEGVGAYPVNTKLALVAHAVPGCTFSRWMDGNKSLGKDTVLEYTLQTETELEAVFTGSPEVANNPLQTASLLRVYPNPAGNTLTVDGAGVDFYAVEIYTAGGRRVLAQQFAQGVQKMEFELEKLVSGAYIVKVLTANGWQISKITKI